MSAAVKIKKTADLKEPSFKLKRDFGDSTRISYDRFDLINGKHPWQDVMKDQVVLYPVRELNRGKVTYFNYALAKEMGLIHRSHPNKLTKELEQKIIKTFSIQIINEFEQEQGVKFDPTIVKTNPYMATRYLQLQHSSRSGKTSGDGRSIWNGYIQNNGKIWDISSRGTGVTKLAPGTSQLGKNLETGNEEIGYGCGQMEIDELYATAISSEIFHAHKIKTERVLAVIDLGKGVAIGVRAAPNLIRPAHIFLYLKQNDHENLKNAINYFIERQIKNKEWHFKPSKNKYDQFLNFIIEKFAQFTARLEVDYIFTWMDWDGDNVLANGGIIDYGSIRQFGCRHDEYRYDDVDRLSTNLNEQKYKARHLVQNFIQIVDFLKSGKKTNLNDYRNHPGLIKFEEEFRHYYSKQRLYNLGFQKNDIDYLLLEGSAEVQAFEKIYFYFESIKTVRQEEKVPDGINRPAIFNMRDLSRELPKLLLKNQLMAVEPIELFHIMMTSLVTSKDQKFKDIYRKKLFELQLCYLKLVEKTARKRSVTRVMREIESRSQVINRADRATGNAIIMVTDKIITNIKNGFPAENIQAIIDSFVESQILTPEKGLYDPKEILKRKSIASKKLLFKLLKITEDHKDEI